MKFAIQVQPNHRWQQSQRLARTLCDQLINDGHEITAIFFYAQATQITTAKAQHHWLDWDHKASPLLVCSTLNDQLELPKTTNEDSGALFTITGMARWMQLSEQADQLVIIP